MNRRTQTLRLTLNKILGFINICKVIAYYYGTEGSNVWVGCRDSLVVLDVFVKALELSDLEREDSHQNHDHQQEGVDSPLNQVLHLQGNPYTHSIRNKVIQIQEAHGHNV